MLRKSHELKNEYKNNILKPFQPQIYTFFVTMNVHLRLKSESKFITLKYFIMELEPIFISAIVFGFAYATIDLFVRRKERMLLIEKGIDAPSLTPKSNRSVFALKLGLLFIGVAVGLLLGSVLAEVTTLNEESAYFSMIFLFGGIGLVISHFIEKKELKEMN